MILRRWDPDIGKEECSGRDKGYVDNNGEWYRRSSPDLVVMGEGNLGILRKDMIMSDLGQISIIINTKSQIFDGIGSDLKVLIWILLLVSLMGSCVLVGAKEVVSDVVGYSMKGLMHETGGEPKDIGSYICFELGLLVHGHRWDNDDTFYLYYFVVVSWYLSRLLTSIPGGTLGSRSGGIWFSLGGVV
ncbi:BnaC01g19680D [Brassica napus]|uniref:BnaC01g19680D protein n=1 Tax=Brassica napus TaxID=3708 RepID=A0A078GUV7_BRANA|nr:BnaC01g19680D [Brassica napus]